MRQVRWAKIGKHEIVIQMTKNNTIDWWQKWELSDYYGGNREKCKLTGVMKKERYQ